MPRDLGKVNLIRGLNRTEHVSRLVFTSLVLLSLTLGILCFLNTAKLVNKPFAGFLINRRLIVSNAGQYSWPGIKEGLKYPDKILKINGVNISSIEELKKKINATPVGKLIAYSIKRQGQIIELKIPTMIFSWNDFFFTFGSSFLSSLVFLFIGIIVYILKPDTRASWAFFLACFFKSIAGSAAPLITDLTFIKLNLLFLSFIPAAVFHLSFVFPEKKVFIEKHTFIQFLPYIVSATVGIPMTVLYPHPSFLPLFKFIDLFYILSPLALFFSTLWSFFKKTSTIARQRAKVILWGAALSLSIPAFLQFTSLFIGKIGNVSILINFLIIPVMIFPVVIAYSIAKHNLFDVDVYIKRTVGYVIMTAIVGSVYFTLQLVMRTIILGPLFGDYAEKVYPVLFAIFVVILFNPINRWVQGTVDKLFYRKKFDYKDTVLSVSNALTSLFNIDEITKRIINTLRKEMFIDRAGVILLDSQRECKALFVSDELYSSKDKITEQCFPPDDPLISLISNEKKMVTKYDIAEAPRYRTVKETCGQRFSDLGASVTLPLTYQDNVTGVLALGYKKSGHFYSREDIQLLETLTNQGAIAIENAKLAEQMKKEETVRTNLSRYLSPQIVDQVVKNDVQLNLGGDRKVVTVLFSDIRQFTTITESRPADQLVHILNEYFTEMARIIFDNQGSLDKYIGDALVAVYGSLVSIDNPAHNAVQTAIEMMKHLPVLNKHWTEEFGFSMDIGIGINTGEVFLGNIGSPERMEFTVIGDAVNVASRFSGLAKAGQILVTKETFTSLKADTIQSRELPPSEIKGKSGKLEVFEIVY
jgi:class 3 adenylate cyclase